MISVASTAATATVALYYVARTRWRARQSRDEDREAADEPNYQRLPQPPSELPPLATMLRFELASVGWHTTQIVLIILNVALWGIVSPLAIVHLAFDNVAVSIWCALSLLGVLLWSTTVGELLVPRRPFVFGLPTHVLVVVAPVSLLNLYLTLATPYGARLAEALTWPLLLGFSAHAILMDVPLILGNRLGNIPSQLMPPTDVQAEVEARLCGGTFRLGRGLNLDGLVKGTLGPILSCWAAFGTVPPLLLGVFTALAAATSIAAVAFVALSFPTGRQIFFNEPPAFAFTTWPGYWTEPLAAQLGLLLIGIQTRKLLEGCC